MVLERLRALRWLSGDSALALILYTALALALVLVSWSDQLNVSLLGYLFGNIVTVGSGDMWATVASGSVVVVVVVVFLPRASPIHL